MKESFVRRLYRCEVFSWERNIEKYPKSNDITAYNQYKKPWILLHIENIDSLFDFIYDMLDEP